MRKFLGYFYWDVFLAIVFGLTVLAALAALAFERLLLSALL
jgi:hypothetical protein